MDHCALANTVDEGPAIARTGWAVPYEAINSGASPAYKRGRRSLLRPADLRHWVGRLPLIKAGPKGSDR